MSSSLNILWYCLFGVLGCKLTFSSPIAIAVFQICQHIECRTSTASSFRILNYFPSYSIIQSLSCVWLFATLWTAAHQASLSITNSWSLLKLMSIKSVMPSNHLILCCPLLLLPSIFPSIRIFSNESFLYIRWLKYWSFSISPSNEYSYPRNE